jgi:NAD/NADP transhydrogenase beta subunit
VDYLSFESFGTAAGAAVAVTIVVSVIKAVAGGWYKPWFVLLLSVGSTVLGAFVADQLPGDWKVWVVAILNGFVTCAAAIGVNTVITPDDKSKGAKGGVMFTRW